MSRLLDAFHVLIGRAEIAIHNEVHALEGGWQFLETEERRVETMLTDALANAIHAVLTERDADKAAVAQAKADLAQAQSDRDAANAQVTALQAQLADAESQINALVAQINPPVAA